MNKFDIFLCCAVKDYNKLKFNVISIMKNVCEFENVYIVTPTDFPFKDQLPSNVIYLKDKLVLDIDINKFKYRSTWQYQMFLKLFQNVTKNDYYVTIDCDVVINRPMRFFNKDNKPIWYLGSPQNCEPYFNFNEKMFGFGRLFPYTFINDMNFFNKSIIKEMLNKHNYTFETFLKKSYDIINKDCHLAEPELYGNYVIKYHPDLYVFNRLKTYTNARIQKNPNINNWSTEEIRNTIIDLDDKDYDILIFHSWFNPNNKTI